MTIPPVFLIVGPAQHGVVAVATEIAHTASAISQSEVVHFAALTDFNESSVRAGAAVHMHFTDRLFGHDCETAAGGFAQFATRLAQLGSSVSVTLHDLPMASTDGDDSRYRRRAAAYADVVSAATGSIIVNSRNEANLLARCAPGVRPAVIALPIQDGPRPEPRRDTQPEVAVLGFIYPGKGHAQALAAMYRLPTRFGFTALGRAADDHDDLIAELQQIAASHRRSFALSGWIPEDELSPRLRQVGIPLAAHREISASASIGSWLAAGRRPLVPDVAFTRELEERCPGSVTRFPSAGLAAALVAAFHDPESTWLASDVVLEPSHSQVAQRYLETLSTC